MYTQETKIIIIFQLEVPLLVVKHTWKNFCGYNALVQSQHSTKQTIYYYFIFIIIVRYTRKGHKIIFTRNSLNFHIFSSSKCRRRTYFMFYVQQLWVTQLILFICWIIIIIILSLMATLRKYILYLCCCWLLFGMEYVRDYLNRIFV